MPDPISELDRLLRAEFKRFVADIRKTKWHGKERDCVHRFAMGYLVEACGPHHFLKHPTQIGIEMAVAKPPRVGARPTAPKDLVIWQEKWPKIWSQRWEALLTPLAVIEWKVSRGRLGGKGASHDEKWLRNFTKSKPESVGYSVNLRFGIPTRHCGIQVSRFFQGAHDKEWLLA